MQTKPTKPPYIWNQLLRSRKTFTWMVGIAAFMWLIVKGQLIGDWAPDYVFWLIGALIFGIAGLSVWQKKQESDG